MCCAALNSCPPDRITFADDPLFATVHPPNVPSPAIRYEKGRANASSLLGTRYEKSDGAFTGPLITGLLQSHTGLNYGCGAAAVGMAFGLAQYAAFRRNLGTRGHTVPNPLPRSAIGWVWGSEL